MKKIWSGIRISIINISKVKAYYIPSILESWKTVDNPCAIANIFNNSVSLLMWVKTLTKTFHSSLINDSFLCGIFSSKLKLAQVTQFLRKALGKTKITVGQHQFYLFLVKFLKRLCLSAFMVILNLDRNILYPLQFGLGKRARQIMHWYKLLNQSVTQLTTMSLAEAFLLI